jgi:shikimate dehydrogenase
LLSFTGDPARPGGPSRTRLGVLGWPVGHSLSPAIQNAALAAVGLREWRYQLLPVDPQLFAEVVAALPEAGFRGANVTIPHKRAVLALANRPTARARAIGAANTLTFDATEIVADNTDAPALISAVPIELAGATALILGAGGSARAAVWALADAGVAEVRVWNRTPERARDHCAELTCTAVGLDGADGLDGLPVAEGDLEGFACVVDFVYRASPTPLVAAAAGVGLPTVDGLDLLVGQGTLSFEQFTGRAAPVEVMRRAARGSPGRPLERERRARSQSGG